MAGVIALASAAFQPPRREVLAALLGDDSDTPPTHTRMAHESPVASGPSVLHGGGSSNLCSVTLFARAPLHDFGQVVTAQYVPACPPPYACEYACPCSCW